MNDKYVIFYWNLESGQHYYLVRKDALEDTLRWISKQYGIREVFYCSLYDVYEVIGDKEQI